MFLLLAAFVVFVGTGCAGREPPGPADGGAAVDAGVDDAGVGDDAGFLGCPVFDPSVDGSAELACQTLGDLVVSPGDQFPQLRIVNGDLLITRGGAIAPFTEVEIELPQLSIVTETIRIDGALGGIVAIRAPALVQARGVDMGGSEPLLPDPPLRSMAFPILSSVDDFIVDGAIGLETLDIEGLRRVGTLIVINSPLLHPLSFPVLADAEQVRLDSAPAFPMLRAVDRLRLHGPGPVELPNLVSARSLVFDVTSSTVLELPELLTVTQLFSMRGPVSRVVLPKLEDVGYFTATETELEEIAWPVVELAREVRLQDSGLRGLTLPESFLALDALVVEEHAEMQVFAATGTAAVGELRFENNPSLNRIEMPALTAVSRVVVSGNATDLSCEGAALIEACGTQ